MTDAAIWLRVWTGHQDSDNQVPDVEWFAGHHGYNITGRYTVSESAWNGGKDGGEYKKALKRALDDAHAGKFKAGDEAYVDEWLDEFGSADTLVCPGSIEVTDDDAGRTDVDTCPSYYFVASSQVARLSLEAETVPR